MKLRTFLVSTHIVAVIVVASTLLEQSAHADSCSAKVLDWKQETPGVAYQHADAVFSGYIENRASNHLPFGDCEYRVNVTVSYKGVTSSLVDIYVERHNGTCFDMNEEQEWILFAGSDDGKLWLDACQTFQALLADAPAHQRFLATVPPLTIAAKSHLGMSWWMVFLFGVAVAFVVALAILRRLRRGRIARDA